MKFFPGLFTVQRDTNCENFSCAFHLVKKSGDLTRISEVQANMIIVCLAVVVLLGKGTYGHIKRKHQDRKRKRQDRVLDEQGYSSSSLPQSSQRARGIRRGRKHQVNARRHHETPHHHHEQRRSNINLGISSEARASAQAHASRSARHTHRQRERDLGVAISLRHARCLNLEEPNEEDIIEALPKYDRDPPRPPSYENCISAPPSLPFREQLDWGSECRMRTVTEPRVERGVWRSEATLESGSIDVYGLGGSYGYTDSRPGPVFPPSR